MSICTRCGDSRLLQLVIRRAGEIHDCNPDPSFGSGRSGLGRSSAVAWLHQHGARRQSLALTISDANACFIPIHRNRYSDARHLDGGAKVELASPDPLKVVIFRFERE